LFVPVALAPTIQGLGRVYSKHIGGTFEYNTGVKLSEGFERKIMQLSHLSIDDGDEEMDKHLLLPMECWSLIL
jgi:hypothetical protein